MPRWSLAALTLVVLAASACSSTSTPTGAAAGGETSAEPPAATDATAYMESLCTSVTEWQQGLEAGSQEFQASVSSGQPSMEDIQQGLEDYLQTAVDDTKALVSEIEALGAPDVDGGDEVAQTLTSGLSQVATLFEGVLASVQGLDSGDPQAIAEALTGLGTDLQQGAADVQTAFESIQNEDLDQIASEIPACSSLG